MQSKLSKGGAKIETQSLFDQMYAVQLDSKGEPIPTEDNTLDTQNPLYQIDPTDAVLLLKAPLNEAISLGGDTWTGSERLIIADCLKQLKVCEKLIEGTKIDSQNVRRFTKEDFDCVNKFVADSEAVLKAKFTDDSTWGGNCPPVLVLKDMMGALPLSEINDDYFMVRGKNYLVDNKKIPGGLPLFHLRGIQVVEQPRGTSHLAHHVALRDWCGLPKTYDQYNEWLILNYMVPGSTTVNVVCLYTASREALEVINSITGEEEIQAFVEPERVKKTFTSPFRSSKKTTTTETEETAAAEARPSPPTSPVQGDKAWANALYRFYTGSDEYRNRTFKLFPRICKASWAIQAAVGNKPALIGNKKLELKYLRGPGYLEIDIDLSSSTIATHILGMVRGVSKSMVVDLGVGIEGIQEDELPEAILGQARFAHVDLDSGCSLTVETASSTKSAKAIFAVSSDAATAAAAVEVGAGSGGNGDSNNGFGEGGVSGSGDKQDDDEGRDNQNHVATAEEITAMKEALHNIPAEKLRRAWAIAPSVPAAGWADVRNTGASLPLPPSSKVAK